MERLIDANSCDVVIAFNDDISNMTCGEAKEYMEKQKAFLNKFPTVDAVKVIRCKDCKHCVYPNARKEWCKKGHLHGYPADWFCADGERKDGEQNEHRESEKA